MKKIVLVVLAMVFMSSFAFSAPWLGCDPYSPTDLQPEYFYVTMDGVVSGRLIHSVAPEGWKIYDLSALTVGQHHADMKACIDYGVWGGETCSATTPFDFGKPVVAPAKVPAGIKLIK